MTFHSYKHLFNDSPFQVDFVQIENTTQVSRPLRMLSLRTKCIHVEFVQIENTEQVFRA
jgi:hypothetical protein